MTVVQFLLAATATDDETIAKARALDAYLLAMPPIPVCVEPSSHVHLYNTYAEVGLV